MPTEFNPFRHLPRGYLSPSQVNSFMLCPQAWYLQYVEKQPSLTSLPAISGQTMHSVLEEDNHHVVDAGEHMSLVDTLEVWSDEWDKRQEDLTDKADRDKKDVHVVQAGHWMDQYLTKYEELDDLTPRSKQDIERKVEGEVGGVPIRGIVDLVSSSGKTEFVEVVDYKTGKRKNPHELETGVQMGIYASILDVPSVRYETFVNNKTPVIQTIQAHRTKRSIAKVERVVTGVSTAISKGSFPFCAPDSWKCNQKYCGVWHACKQGGKA